MTSDDINEMGFGKNRNRIQLKHKKLIEYFEVIT